MIRIATLHAVAPRVQYHKRSNALSASEREGEWLGAGCAAAGLKPGSQVMEDSLRMLLCGYSPDGRYLGKNRKRCRRAGWDVVVSVHKSLSVAALCLDEITRAAVKEAYQEAVYAFAALIDTLACRQNAGLRPVVTGNAIIAAFTHERSRHNDPHLHTHFLVINATLDSSEEGRGSWRSLEPAPIFRQHKALDLAFNRELLRGLHARGLPAEFDKNGRAMLRVIPGPVCERFSTANRVIRRAAQRPRPAALQSLNEEHYRDLLNDRLRPPKTPPTVELTVALQPTEREQIASTLASAPAPPRSTAADPAKIPQMIEQQFHRDNLFYTPKALFLSVIEVAREYLATPLKVFFAASAHVRIRFAGTPRVRRSSSRPAHGRSHSADTGAASPDSENPVQGSSAWTKASTGGTSHPKSPFEWAIEAAKAQILRQRAAKWAPKPIRKAKPPQGIPKWAKTAALAKILSNRTASPNKIPGHTPS